MCNVYINKEFFWLCVYPRAQLICRSKPKIKKRDITLATSPGLDIVEYIVVLHGEHGNETDVRAERSEIYRRDGDLGDELSWMAPIYENLTSKERV